MEEGPHESLAAACKQNMRGVAIIDFAQRTHPPLSTMSGRGKVYVGAVSNVADDVDQE